MAKDKERSINPAQAQRKAEKSKAIKKGKAEQLTRRNEKLAARNPHHIERQLHDLKALETAGTLTAHEKSLLESLERDLKAVKKARDALGDRAPTFGSGSGAGAGRGAGRGDAAGARRGGGRGEGRGGFNSLGKRRRDDEENESDDPEIPDDVRRIPMPRDTPPPIPKEVLDKWYAARRARYQQARNEEQGGGREDGGAGAGAGAGTNANRTPLGSAQDSRRAALGLGQRHNTSQTHDEGTSADLPSTDLQAAAPPAPSRPAAQITYESKPILRDLRKEAVAFVPAAVRVKMEKGKGTAGALLEPEEADRLEKEGYLGTSKTVQMEEVEDEDG